LGNEGRLVTGAALLTVATGRAQLARFMEDSTIRGG
jgi:hypothetical protein